VLLGRG